MNNKRASVELQCLRKKTQRRGISEEGTKFLGNSSRTQILSVRRSLIFRLLPYFLFRHRTQKQASKTSRYFWKLQNRGNKICSGSYFSRAMGVRTPPRPRPASSAGTTRGMTSDPGWHFVTSTTRDRGHRPSPRGTPARAASRPARDCGRRRRARPAADAGAR